MRSSEPLTAAEASFIALDQPGIPMHIGALLMLEGSPALTTHDVQRLVATRLRGMRRFHQRVRQPLGRRPSWVRAGRLRPEHHFFHHVLPPHAHEAKLLALCAEIHQAPLDRRRPLWQMHLIDGVPGGRQALFIKTHHAMGDGLAGIAVGELLFDPAPGASRPEVPLTVFGTGTHAPPPWNVLEAMLGMAVTAAGGPIANDGPFNGHVGGERVFAMATLPMREVRRVKAQLAVTVDDVLTATVAAGLGRYLREVQSPLIPERLRAMVPVSLRGSHATGSQNQVSAVFVDLPIDGDDAIATLDDIADQKDALRRGHAAAGNSVLVEVAALLPAPLHSAVLKAVSSMRFANLVLSDIPGPRQQLYLLGHRVAGCYPMMPLAPSIALSIAAVSMSGKIGVGVTADPSIVADARHLAHAIEAAWAVFAHSEPRDLEQREAA